MVTPAMPHVSRILPPFRPILEVRPNYCRLPLADGFNWSAAFAAVPDGDWHLVAFRSKHAPGADEAFLTALDERASEAASRYPGFLYYFIGTPQTDGGCLSFCLWQSATAARAASADPAHRAAVAEGLPCFAYYRLERYALRKEHGALSFEALAAPAMPARTGSAGQRAPGRNHERAFHRRSLVGPRQSPDDGCSNGAETA
jgi:heme-degrading monooxygenase HmoA